MTNLIGAVTNLVGAMTNLIGAVTNLVGAVGNAGSALLGGRSGLRRKCFSPGRESDLCRRWSVCSRQWTTLEVGFPVGAVFYAGDAPADNGQYRQRHPGTIARIEKGVSRNHLEREMT